MDASERALGFPIALRLGEDPELEAGAVGSPVGAAISKRVACRVEAALLMIGFGFRWSKTGSEGPRDVLDFADMHEGISEEGWRWRAAIYALNHPVPVMSAKVSLTSNRFIPTSPRTFSCALVSRTALRLSTCPPMLEMQERRTLKNRIV